MDKLKSESREDNIYFARLSEQAERYADMIKYMKIVAQVSLLAPLLFISSVWKRAVQRRKKPAECGLQEPSQDQERCVEDYPSHLQQGGAEGKLEQNQLNFFYRTQSNSCL